MNKARIVSKSARRMKRIFGPAQSGRNRRIQNSGRHTVLRSHARAIGASRPHGPKHYGKGDLKSTAITPWKTSDGVLGQAL